MKTIACAAVFALLVISVVAPRSASAQPALPSASGTYKFILGDNLTKSVEFSASSDDRGTTTGQMTYRDEAGANEQDPDSGEAPKDPPAEFYMTADLKSLKIENNRAVMNGTIRESSNPAYIGRWVQLVVEDNGDGSERPDQLAWCFCKPEEGGWIPQDSEDPRDDGALMNWWATDAEVREDQGIASPNIIPGTRTACATFALSAYEFADARGEGQIQVHP